MCNTWQSAPPAAQATNALSGAVNLRLTLCGRIGGVDPTAGADPYRQELDRLHSLLVLFHFHIGLLHNFAPALDIGFDYCLELRWRTACGGDTIGSQQVRRIL